MKRIIEVLLIVIVLFFGASVFLLSNHIGGWRAFIVLSPSMEPTLKTGSLIISRQARPGTLKVGDVITFIPPVKNRQFITHRIQEIYHNKSVIAFKTKGDKNKNEDPWILAGGGVVGQVIFTIPYLGFLMSFIQSKVGIILFILLPAAYIIIDEIFNIINIIKHNRKKNSSTEQIVAIMLFLFLNLLFFTPAYTHGLLTDSVSLSSNSFSVVVSPTPFPTPSPCPGNINVNISGNGAGSSNTVDISSNCSTTINQTNSSTVINSIK